ncbi:MAG: hypothetical protein A2521_10280 [Deltaproteobacteria bacterium RIFOXYD12_FULL_57_12]|nr:MAG: hypothetical protein A2521_10280 [Deltaproteobacteria bacterium RIFOXYD12_FULL_57_12]
MAKVFFLFDTCTDEKDILDGMRSTLGLSVANHYAFCAVLSHTLAPFDDYNKENLEWIRDMEGDAFTLVPANQDNGLTLISIEELGQKLRDVDFIVPYGN